MQVEVARFEAEGVLRSFVASRTAGGDVELRLGDSTLPVTSECVLVWTFGGLGAAVGAVPIGASVEPAEGAPISLGSCAVLDEWGEADPALVPEVILDRLLAAFRAIQTATGCAVRRD